MLLTLLLPFSLQAPLTSCSKLHCGSPGKPPWVGTRQYVTYFISFTPHNGQQMSIPGRLREVKYVPRGHTAVLSLTRGTLKFLVTSSRSYFSPPTWISLGLPASRTEKIHFCCLRHSIYGILLWQPEKNKTIDVFPVLISQVMPLGTPKAPLRACTHSSEITSRWELLLEWGLTHLLHLCDPRI